MLGMCVDFKSGEPFCEFVWFIFIILGFFCGFLAYWVFFFHLFFFQTESTESCGVLGRNCSNGSVPGFTELDRRSRGFSFGCCCCCCCCCLPGCYRVSVRVSTTPTTCWSMRGEECEGAATASRNVYRKETRITKGNALENAATHEMKRKDLHPPPPPPPPAQK